MVAISPLATQFKQVLDRANVENRQLTQQEQHYLQTGQNPPDYLTATEPTPTPTPIPTPTKEPTVYAYKPVRQQIYERAARVTQQTPEEIQARVEIASETKTKQQQDIPLSSEPLQPRIEQRAEEIKQQAYTTTVSPTQLATTRYQEFQGIQKDYHRLQQQYESIKPELMYTSSLFPDREVKGTELRAAMLPIIKSYETEYIPSYQKAYLAAARGQQEFDPTTKIRRYDLTQWRWDEKQQKYVKGKTIGATKGMYGYAPEFAYAGAERFKYYQKALSPPKNLWDVGGHLRVFGLHLSTALTGEDPLGIRSAMHKAMGEEQKAIQVKVSSLAHIKSIKNPWDATMWYLSSPVTQIGLAAAGGMAIGALGKTATAVVLSKTLIGSTAITAGKVGLGAGMGYFGYKELERSYKEEGLPGLTARATVLGFGVAGGAAGYRYVSGPATMTTPRVERPNIFKSAVKFAPELRNKMLQKFPQLKGDVRTYAAGERVGVLKTIQPKLETVGGGRFVRYTRSLGETKFAKNISGWAKGELIRGKTYIAHSEGPPTEVKGWNVQRITFKPDKSVRFWNRVHWISKERFTKFHRYIAESGKVKTEPFKIVTGTQKQTGVLTEKVIFKPKWGTYRKTYFFKREIGNIESKPIIAYEGKSTIGSYFRKDVKPKYEIIPMRNYQTFTKSTLPFDYSKPEIRQSFIGSLLEKGWMSKTQRTPIKLAWEIGSGEEYKITQFGRTIGFLSDESTFIKGFGSRYQTPLPKTWIYGKIQRGFIKSTEAIQSLVPKVKTTLTPKPRTSLSVAMSEIKMLTAQPSYYIGFEKAIPMITPVAIGTISTGMSTTIIPYRANISGPIVKSELIPIKTPMLETQKISETIQQNIPIQRRIPVEEQIITQIPLQTQIPIFQHITTPVSVQQQVIVDVPRPVETILPVISLPPTLVPQTIVVPPPVWGGGAMGVGKGGGGFPKLYGKGYRIRKWKMPSLERLLGGK